MYSLEQAKPRMTIIGIVTHNVKVHGMGGKDQFVQNLEITHSKGC